MSNNQICDKIYTIQDLPEEPLRHDIHTLRQAEKYRGRKESKRSWLGNLRIITRFIKNLLLFNFGHLGLPSLEVLDVSSGPA